jgi:hypothetical protein
MAQTCLQCSGSFDDSARFCPGCGYPTPILPLEEPPVEAEESVVTGLLQNGVSRSVVV